MQRNELRRKKYVMDLPCNAPQGNERRKRNHKIGKMPETKNVTLKARTFHAVCLQDWKFCCRFKYRRQDYSLHISPQYQYISRISPNIPLANQKNEDPEQCYITLARYSQKYDFKKVTTCWNFRTNPKIILEFTPKCCFMSNYEVFGYVPNRWLSLCFLFNLKCATFFASLL